MKTRFVVTLLGVGACCALSSPIAAHGGQYRGPGDVVPPGGGGGGGGRGGPGSTPTTGQPGQPTGPTPGVPTAPPPITGGGNGPTAPTPGGPGGGRTGTRLALEPDLSTWEYWWEFNKDAYLHLKSAVHASVETGEDGFFLGGVRWAREQTLRPSTDQLVKSVLPALQRTIESSQQPDIATSCMIAMAKIGADHPTFTLVDVFRQRLQRRDQETRETAALALGIAGRIGNGEHELLIDLALDAPAGRAAYGGEIDHRTRSFAIYGLGLLTREHARPALQRRALTALRGLVDDERTSNRNLKVAALQAIGLLGLDGSDPERAALRDEAIACVAGYFTRPLGAGEQLIQAHCPTVLVKLVGRTGPLAAKWKATFAEELAGADGGKRRSVDIHRSCALALGQLCGPREDATSPDAAHSELLWRTHVEHRDDQTRYFAVLALGQIGGAANRAQLLDGMRRAQKATARPWFALALGVLAHAQRAALLQAGRQRAEDAELTTALRQQLKDAHDPGLVGALGIALGLSHDQEAAEAMRKRLRAEPQKEQQAGYLALGLALMDDRASVEVLHHVLATASRRPELLRQASVALGLLGDKSAAEALRERLGDGSANLATFAALSSALGLIGDRRSIDPLLRLLGDESAGPLSRAFAAVALGGIADRAPLPWSTKLAANLNYRASVETLTNQNDGILDIL